MPLIPARIDAVTLAVSDLQRSTQFYRDVMGFEQVSSSEAVSGFRLGAMALDLIDRQVLLDETYLDDFPPPPAPVTLVLRVTRDEVDECMRRLEEAGVRIVAPAEDKPLGPRIGYAADPDGHLWEIGAFD
jgi:catechol 2,3-dioxygenase-like lactoylglutathione lyase family enzyme